MNQSALSRFIPALSAFSACSVCVMLCFLPYRASAQQRSGTMQQADAAYRAGQAALANQDLATARADFETVVHLAPSLESGHNALGLVLVRSGQLKAGIHELEMALTLVRTDSTAQLNLAQAYQQAAQPAKAIPLFVALESEAKSQKKALSPTVLASYARALASMGKLDAASVKMKAATQGALQDATLHDDLGSIYAQQRKWPLAQKEFASAVEINAANPIAHLHLGLAMQAQNDPGALKELAFAAQLAPENSAIALEYGKALAHAGEDLPAIDQFQNALAHDPDAVAVDYELALALQRTNRAPEAVELLQKVVAAQPENAGALTNLGMALLQIQRAKDAVPLLKRAAALAPEDATAHQDLAAAFVQLSQFADAVLELQAAIKLAPNLPQLHYDLGLAYKMQDDAANAIPELEIAEKLDPRQSEAPYALGMLYMQAGRYEDAARELKESLTLQPQNGDAWATLGSVYNKLDRLRDAVAALEEAIRQLPNQPDPHLTLAAVLARQNNPDEAVAQRKLAASLMRIEMNRQRAEVATHAGQSLLKNGDLAGAATQFADALSFDANYAAAHEGLARVLDAQGKPTEAAVERQKASAPNP